MYSQRIIVTGGAGYIGSHFCKYAKSKGHKIYTIDNLSTGFIDFVLWGDFVNLDIRDTAKLREIILKIKPHYLVHFAASAYVHESFLKPLDYISNNITGMESITRVCSELSIPIIFSSSCSVYGEVKTLPISESSELMPLSPYGETKLFCEKILSWSSKVSKFKYVSLRYFNAAGADFDLKIGEKHNPETHIIPLVIRSLGCGEKLKIFGNNYNTEDGTAIRDYIHVNDLARAHLKAIEYLNSGGNSDIFNLGSGNGTSIKEIINLLEKISDLKCNKVILDKRVGDPSVLFADINKAKNILNWEPKYSNIETILRSAWNWYKKNNS
tara:strand:+ start:698 stop:1675 length:978 start_codon:yes stop_codon:yes gene_type:complete